MADDLVQNRLSAMIRRHGTGVISDPERVESLLHDYFPQHNNEVEILMGAVTAQVPVELLASSEPSQRLYDHLIGRLREDRDLTDEAARWAVETWARALLPDPEPSTLPENSAFSTPEPTPAVVSRRPEVGPPVVETEPTPTVISRRPKVSPATVSEPTPAVVVKRPKVSRAAASEAGQAVVSSWPKVPPAAPPEPAPGVVARQPEVPKATAPEATPLIVIRQPEVRPTEPPPAPVVFARQPEVPPTAPPAPEPVAVVRQSEVPPAAPWEPTTEKVPRQPEVPPTTVPEAETEESIRRPVVPLGPSPIPETFIEPASGTSTESSGRTRRIVTLLKRMFTPTIAVAIAGYVIFFLSVKYLQYRADVNVRLARMTLQQKFGVEMVEIPAGEFTMGTSEDEVVSIVRSAIAYKKEWFTGEMPQHRVYLNAYYIAKNLVTVKQYLTYCAATGHARPPAPPYDPNWSHEDHPIVNINWQDANDYCAWLSAQTGLKVMLPTEAEWEKAARGPTGRRYPFGNDWDRTKCANSVDPNNMSSPKPVGSYPLGASYYGVLDMAGNVYQWCRDWYDVNYYKMSPDSTPFGPAISPDSCRVIRGGSWTNYVPISFRCASRTMFLPQNIDTNIGFRCVVHSGAR